MKTENIFIKELQREIVFHIGKNKQDNFKIIDNGKAQDLWFHAKNDSSCHIVCEMNSEYKKNELKIIAKLGALMCKNNTNKLKNLRNVEIIYTCIKNVTKTDIEGCVITTNTKTIMC